MGVMIRALDDDLTGYSLNYLNDNVHGEGDAAMKVLAPTYVRGKRHILTQ